jgi:hypothetical protein
MTALHHPEVHPQQLVLDAAPRPLTLPFLLQAHRLRVFYGDLHNHTAYSDGVGDPAQALRQMRAQGLHFAAITDHAELLDRPRPWPDAHPWEATLQQVTACSDEGFVALRGFEWSSPRQGHSNVWGSAAYTGYHDTGDDSMQAFYAWLAEAQPMEGAQVLASFNHPGREALCFDGCVYVPALDDRLVVLECFNRRDEYGDAYFQALDRGWHVGAIGVSDHHGDDWGHPSFPRTGLLAPALTLSALQTALAARRVFATRSPSLALLLTGNDALMGARLQLPASVPLRLGIWCHDAARRGGRARLELWSTGGSLVETYETRGVQHLSWGVAIAPRPGGEHWFVVRLLHRGEILAYSSPIWARWGSPDGGPA